ncbi:MAG: hypothetical protein MJE63_14540 [Proteobacteria bacterium]|nr:hypothetical protein [Pseudomonadota bacterium]
MALFNLFGKKLKGENKYFKSRVADARQEGDSDEPKADSKPKPVSRSESREQFPLISERIINKTLLTELLKLMRNYDVQSTVTVLANTLDTNARKAAIMINKGYIPKRIVAYLQNINMRNIEDSIKLARNASAEENGFVSVDERTAANLNLPLGCMLLGIYHHLKDEFAVVLVAKTSLKDKEKFVEKVRETIRRS